MIFNNDRKGFTLMETVVALGIAAIALSFFIAAFAPATLGIKKASRVQEAKNLVSALQAEMGVVRLSEVNAAAAVNVNTVAVTGGTYQSPFDKAFQWVTLNGAVPNGLILAFQYKADSDQPCDTDGNFAAYVGASHLGLSSTQPMILQNRICLINNVISSLPTGSAVNYDDRARYAQIEGGAYVIELTQLVYNAAGVLTPHSSSAQVVDPNATASVAANYLDIANFPDACLRYQADVYYLKSNDPAYLATMNGLGTPLNTRLGNPIYSTQLGVFR